jgi:hypothetical protein
MPLLELAASSWFGSLLGMRHALEADHLAAVTTLVSRERNSLRAALLGMWWGLGHTLALVVVGTALVVFRAEMPPGAADVFELGVGIMLVVLGLRAVRQAVRQGADGPLRLHRHGRIVHSHRAGASHLHIGTWTLARRPLIIGAVHGLAGSGALTALVLTTLPTPSSQLAYVLLFGIGSTVSMAAMSGLLGWPLARLGSHHAVARSITLAVGCLSTALGVVWGYWPLARLL